MAFVFTLLLMFLLCCNLYLTRYLQALDDKFQAQLDELKTEVEQV